MKPWYTSKTVWFNMFCLAMAGIETQFSLMQELLGQWYGLVYLIVIVGNIMLRFITNQGIVLRT